MKKKVTIIFASGTKHEIEFDANMTSGLTADYNNYLANGKPTHTKVSTGSSYIELFIDFKQVAAIIC
ncbi:MAG: hypothetical protein WCQ95_10665 [Bacteroidota bacterium]